MITAHTSQRPRVTGLMVEEDGGLASLMGSTPITLAREQALQEKSVLQIVQDVLQSSFHTEERRQYLDPFAPAAERNAEVVAVLRSAIADHRQHGGILARVPTDDETLLALFAATIGWGPAQRYLDDPRVNEIKIVGLRIRVQESGKPFVTVPEQFSSIEEVRNRAMLLVSVLGIRLDAEVPQSTLPLAHGTRMHITIPPRVARDSILVCIRRGRNECWNLDDVRKRGTINDELATLLRLFCRARCSFLIAGRTGSGKTALLEALANSWPGDPHIITIEDHTSEIGIARAELWTREQVNTEHDPFAFGRVAKEAMRQTPDLLLPGETRGSEAGAILAMVLSDHPVMTTLHARSCHEAVERFSSFAALPGAYMYESHREAALRDTCIGFDIVIKMDVWENLGLRVITELALVAGTEHDRVSPILVPLATITAGPDGRFMWEVSASVGTDGMLAWTGDNKTPQSLREKLARAHILAQIQTTATSLDIVSDTIARASRHLLANEAERALAVLRSAWAERRDERLITMAQQALAQVPNSVMSERANAVMLRTNVEQLIHARRWKAAHQQYEALLSDLVMTAAATPIGGWERIEGVIKNGLTQEGEAEQASLQAEVALRQGQARLALDLLNRFVLSELPNTIALSLIQIREQAMAALIVSGQGSHEALATVRAQRVALEASVAQEQAADLA